MTLPDRFLNGRHREIRLALFRRSSPKFAVGTLAREINASRNDIAGAISRMKCVEEAGTTQGRNGLSATLYERHDPSSGCCDLCVLGPSDGDLCGWKEAQTLPSILIE